MQTGQKLRCASIIPPEFSLQNSSRGLPNAAIRFGGRRTAVGVVIVLALAANMANTVAAEVRIGPDNLADLPAGTTVHASVKPALLPTADGATDPVADAHALAFSGGGISLPTEGLLAAAHGSIALDCRVPEPWPAEDDRTLLHIAARPHAHVTLFFRGGLLLAVYKGGEDHFASLRCDETVEWKPGSWHRVQFSWQAVGDEEVDFLLMVDGKLIGVATGRRIDTWPERCEVAMRDGSRPWQGLLRNIVVSSEPIVPPNLTPGNRTITVDGDRPMGECYRFWTVGNYNKPHRFATPGYSQRIPKGQPYIKQVNAVYLLGGRYRDQNNWFQGVASDGQIQTDFAGLIAQLKGIEQGGLRPWIVLDNVPYNMSDPPQENTYGNTAPPADERIWEQYVEAAVRAMVEAFGHEKVAGWWFRVGTEPDLNPSHWVGTKEQYLAHYDHTVAALKRVLPEAIIGPGNILNPADAKTSTRPTCFWGLDIIDHAATGTNAVTGQQGTAMDWFSFSWYGRVGQPLTVFDQAVSLTRNRLKRYPQFAGLPLIVGEFAVLHDESGRRIWGGDTTEWAASFYAALADRVYAHNIRQVYEWSQTTGGVLHPRTQVIKMLDWMSDGNRLAVDIEATSAANCGAIGCRKQGELFALVYNHRPLRRPTVSEGVHLVFRDARLKAGSQWRLSEWRIDAEHAAWARAFAADCEAAGVRPLPKAGRFEGAISYLYGEPGAKVFYKNREKYARLAALPKTQDDASVTVADGRFSLDFEMPGHSVRLLRLAPVE